MPSPSSAKASVLATTILAVEPGASSEVELAFGYRKKNVYPKLRKRVANVVQLEKGAATSNSVHNASRPGVGLITGSSHGSPKTFSGRQGEIYISGTYPAADPRGKIIHLLACETASDLGIDFVSNGCKAFFGYDDLFGYPPGKEKAFFACDAVIDLALAAGCTATDVHAQVMAEVEARASKFELDKDPNTAGTLRTTFGFLRSSANDPQLGDPLAKLG